MNAGDPGIDVSGTQQPQDVPQSYGCEQQRCDSGESEKQTKKRGDICFGRIVLTGDDVEGVVYGRVEGEYGDRQQKEEFEIGRPRKISQVLQETGRFLLNSITAAGRHKIAPEQRLHQSDDDDHVDC